MATSTVKLYLYFTVVRWYPPGSLLALLNVIAESPSGEGGGNQPITVAGFSRIQAKTAEVVVDQKVSNFEK